ncbi:hypothetical protein ACFE04_016049 [Oxalis oulophora]
MDQQAMVLSDSDENNNINNINIKQPQAQAQGQQQQKGMRRALSLINENLINGSKPYPCVLLNNNNKRLPLEQQQQQRKPDALPLPLCEKDLLVSQPHRPITRKFAADIDNNGSNQQLLPEECKKLKPTAPTTNHFGSFIFIDADDDESKTPITDLPVPMSLDKAKLHQMEEEVEMEDIEEDEPIMDIDSFDANNPLAAVDYVQDMYAYYRTMEGVSCVSPNYMAQQFDINEKMRAILIDWLIEVHDKFDLMSETLFLTVNVIDRFLSQQNVARKKLQLVGLVAMLVACKYEEVSVPIVGDLILISDKAYNRKDILETEKLMLNTLQFNMSVPTPYVFMQRFLKAAQADKKLEMLSFFLIELALVEYEMLKFPPSLLAASAIYAAQCSLYGFKQWNRTCEWHSGYTEHQLLECSRLIVGYHQSAATGKVTGVHRKYCTSKFGYIAKCEPALSLLGIRL